MKKISILFIIFCLILSGCSGTHPQAQVVATTMPLYTFCKVLCQNTDITVAQLIQDEVSCLHDYTLQVGQMQLIEAAEVMVINGAGLEDFLSDALDANKSIINCAEGIPLLHQDSDAHHHTDAAEHSHDHEADPHFWLSPQCARIMAKNTYNGLVKHFPQHKETLEQNLTTLDASLAELQTYGETQLSNLQTRDLITFHDGFSYFAESFQLNIVAAIEEEPGTETSAGCLIDLITRMQTHQLSTLFTETNGSTASAQIVAAESGASIYRLDMAMSQGDYFEKMYYNINTIKEALG